MGVGLRASNMAVILMCNIPWHPQEEGAVSDLNVLANAHDPASAAGE